MTTLPKLLITSLALALLFPFNVFAADVTATWDGVAEVEANIGDSTYGYFLHRRQSNCVTPSTWTIFTLIPGVTTHMSTGLVDGADYCWYVTAFNPAGESGESNRVDLTIGGPILPTIPPDAPTNLQVQ